MNKKSRLVFVGEMNPYGSGAHYALYCWPVGSAGERLQSKIMGMSQLTYLKCHRYNLCEGKWSMPAARIRAHEIRERHRNDVLVLCGRKVANAFGLGQQMPFTLITDKPVSVLIPHPSGLNRLWNDTTLFEKSRNLIERALTV